MAREGKSPLEALKVAGFMFVLSGMALPGEAANMVEIPASQDFGIPRGMAGLPGAGSPVERLADPLAPLSLPAASASLAPVAGLLKEDAAMPLAVASRMARVSPVRRTANPIRPAASWDALLRHGTRIGQDRNAGNDPAADLGALFGEGNALRDLSSEASEDSGNSGGGVSPASAFGEPQDEKAAFQEVTGLYLLGLKQQVPDAEVAKGDPWRLRASLLEFLVESKAAGERPVPESPLVQKAFRLVGEHVTPAVERLLQLEPGSMKGYIAFLNKGLGAIGSVVGRAKTLDEAFAGLDNLFRKPGLVRVILRKSAFPGDDSLESAVKDFLFETGGFRLAPGTVQFLTMPKKDYDLVTVFIQVPRGCENAAIRTLARKSQVASAQRPLVQSPAAQELPERLARELVEKLGFKSWEAGLGESDVKIAEAARRILKIEPLLQKKLKALKPGQVVAVIIQVNMPILTYPPQLPRAEVERKALEVYATHSKPIRDYLDAEHVKTTEMKNLGFIVAELDRHQALDLIRLDAVRSLRANQPVDLIGPVK